ncbi:MAG TPA: VOC family protein [Gemmatimonadales bacterium]|jgi:methylmalonyl-CoA/ethylmalonyl-CoA epimerase|nr:VOC family protein [Gemmatimonadales bacterium]
MPASTQTFGISSIGQIFIRAIDLNRAITFYRDTLGMPFLFQAPPQMAFFQCGPTTVLLGVPENRELDHPASTVYYLVPDIAAAHKTLRERGVEFIVEPHLVHRAPDYELWLAEFRDSEGNMLALMMRKPRA